MSLYQFAIIDEIIEVFVLKSKHAESKYVFIFKPTHVICKNNTINVYDL